MLNKTVSDSQVINWLELFEGEGIIFDLIIIPTGIKAFIKNYNLRKQKLFETNKFLSGKKRQFFTIKSATVFGNALIFIQLMVFLFKDILRGNNIIIQTRNDYYYYSFKWVNQIYSKFHFIYDVRGLGVEEQILSNNLSNNNYNFKKGKYLKAFLKFASHILCVSNRLKEYLLINNNSLNKNKITVIPGCADANSFYFDNTARKLIRKQLNLENSNVIIYSGGLDKKWQIPDKLFGYVCNLQINFSNIFFICLTPNTDIAHKKADKFKISSDKIFIKYVSCNKLNDYLSAADFGLLLRENSIVNNVASPTKFAEYLMAGLPVIISKGIGDFSEFVRFKNAGICIDSPFDKGSELLYKEFFKKEYDRDIISKIGEGYFSKQRHLSKILRIYENILNYDKD